VTVLSGESIVTGLNTSFLTEVSVGDSFKKKSENSIYTLGAVNSNTQITLTSKYAGSGESGVEYQIGRDFTPNFALPEVNVGDVDWPVHLTQSLRAIDTYLGDGRFVVATGSANAYVLTPTIAIPSYSNGLLISFVANFANTGAATVNISGLGAKALKKFNDQVLETGDIEVNQIVVIRYDLTGNYFQILSSTAAVTGSGALVRATSPTLVTPALGTPDSGNLGSCTGYPGLAITAGKTITVTENTSLDEAVAMSSKAPKASPSFTVGIGIGGAAAGTGGVAFPASAVAIADPNTLDDYEEGTWTPNVGGSATYTIQAGKYIKIGRQVTLWGQLTINVLGTGNAAFILGVPFTASGANSGGIVTFFSDLAISVYNSVIEIDVDGTTAWTNTQGALDANIDLQSVIFRNGAAIRFTIFYISAS